MQHRDIASVVRRAEEFLFLDEIISYPRTEPPTKRKPKALQEEQSAPEGPTLLDKFMKRTREDESQDDVVTGKSSADIVMDEDGIMYTA